ncbi:MAG: SRPBCC family protein [Planctomycetes bacterium]|nr:SRPBCC family protein [Planctomycetota bacterium]
MSKARFVMTAVVLSLAASVVVFVAVGQVLVAQWQVSTSRSLAAPPARVAALLVDLDRWAEWSAVRFELGAPTNRRVEGQPGTVGHAGIWEGPIGSATLRFTAVREDGVEFALRYEFAGGGLDEGRLSGKVEWRADGAGTLVTWTEGGRLDTLMARWSNWFGALQDHVRQVQGASLGGLERALRSE